MHAPGTPNCGKRRWQESEEPEPAMSVFAWLAWGGLLLLLALVVAILDR